MMWKRNDWPLTLTGLAILLLLTPATRVEAQEQAAPSPLANFVLTGYGSTQYVTSIGDGLALDELDNNFGVSVSPVLLFQMGDDILFESELEFGLSGEQTTTTLEYAQVNYLVLERFVITAGKFLMHFGVFSERLHPSWINKMANAPILYGHAHGGVADESLLPMLADAGVM